MKFYEKYPELRGKDFVSLEAAKDALGFAGVCVSKEVFEQIKGDVPVHLKLTFAHIGVENIKLPAEELI